MVDYTASEMKASFDWTVCFEFRKAIGKAKSQRLDSCRRNSGRCGETAISNRTGAREASPGPLAPTRRPRNLFAASIDCQGNIAGASRLKLRCDM